jgi:ATP-binding cassette subfamily G (WHITE) protein 2 (SNQ2)
LFKRGLKAQALRQVIASDEEKLQAATGLSSTVGSENSTEKKNQAMYEQPKMTKTFSWRHLNYVVSVSGERRLLLDDVSGFVAPGKLTALMGESGAGKVRYFFLTCSRFS